VHGTQVVHVHDMQVMCFSLNMLLRQACTAGCSSGVYAVHCPCVRVANGACVTHASLCVLHVWDQSPVQYSSELALCVALEHSLQSRLQIVSHDAAVNCNSEAIVYQFLRTVAAYERSLQTSARSAEYARVHYMLQGLPNYNASWPYMMVL
jgi:hypothetical protein